MLSSAINLLFPCDFHWNGVSLQKQSKGWKTRCVRLPNALCNLTQRVEQIKTSNYNK